LSGGAIQLSAPGQDATVTGFTFSLERGDGQLDYRLVSHDTGALAPLFPPGAPRLPTAHWTGPRETLPIWLPNSGHGTASGTVRIDVVGYSARVDLDLAGVVNHSLGAADRLHGTLTLEPLAVENLRLEGTAGPGALILSGRIPLAASGHSVASEPLDLGIDASQWPAAGLEPYLPIWFPVAGLRGEASGRIDLGGDFEHLTGSADAEIEDLAVTGIALGRLRGQISWDPAHFALADGLLEAPAGKLLAHGSFDRVGGGIDLTLDAPALDLAGEPLAGRLRLPGLAGKVALMAAIGGNLDRPQATVSLRGEGISYDHRPLAGDAADTAQVTIHWDGELVRASGALGSLVTFDGGGKLDRRQAAIRLDLRSDRLASLLHLAVPTLPEPAAAAPAVPASGGAAPDTGPPPLPAHPPALPALPALPAIGATAAFNGSLSGALTFDADFTAARYQGELRLDSLRLVYAGHEIANREPVVVDLTPQRLAIRSLDLAEAGGDLEAFAFGSLGLSAPMPLDLRFESTLSATWVKLFVPGVDFGGAVDLLASVRGTLANPDLSGQAVLRDARIVLPSLATLDGIEGTLRFYRDRVVLDELTGRLGGGTVKANGQMALPGAGRVTSYRLDLTAQGVSLRFPEGFVSRGDATLSLVGTGVSRQLQGVIQLNRELYVQDLQVDPFVLVLRGLQRERVRVAPTSPLLAGTQMKLSILGPGALRVTNNVADLHGDIDLTVAGTLASPVVFGSVKLDQGGTLEYSDNKYQVERGTLTFANPNRIDPIIDLSLQTEVQSYQITLNLSGTLEKLNAKFSSNAELADIDILSLLASGSRPEIGAPPPPGPQSEAAGQAAASQFLAGQASSALGTRVGRLFGLDRFRIDTQTLTQAGEPTSGVVITAGKRLSKNIFITYVSNPSSPRLDVRQIEWTVAKNLTILLTQSDTSFAVDIQRETRF
jgi:autotransporter translocation and assembly factor TamB